MATVYNTQGESVELDSVDAREYIAGGQWFAVPPEKPVKAKKAKEPGDGQENAAE